MQETLFITLLVLAIVLSGTIVSLLYYIFVQKPEMKREVKINRKKILDFLHNNPPTHLEIEKFAKIVDIEEYTVRDILLDLVREGNLQGLLVFPDEYYDFEYCRDQILSLAENYENNQIPLRQIGKALETTKYNLKKILIELITNQWIQGTIDFEKEILFLQKEVLDKNVPYCPFCGVEVSTSDHDECPNCGAEFRKCGVCNLIIGTEDSTDCPYCGLPSHTDHLLEWLKIKAKCPVCKHELHEFNL